jgi:hypothetical protein
MVKQDSLRCPSYGHLCGPEESLVLANHSTSGIHSPIRIIFQAHFLTNELMTDYPVAEPHGTTLPISKLQPVHSLQYPKNQFG